MSDSDADVQEERELRPCQVVHVKMPEEMQQSAFEVSAVVVLLRWALCTLNAQKLIRTLPNLNPMNAFRSTPMLDHDVSPQQSW